MLFSLLKIASFLTPHPVPEQKSWGGATEETKQCGQRGKCTKLSKYRRFSVPFQLPHQALGPGTCQIRGTPGPPSFRWLFLSIPSYHHFSKNATFSKLTSNATFSLKPFPLTQSPTEFTTLACHSHFSLCASINYFYNTYTKHSDAIPTTSAQDSHWPNLTMQNGIKIVIYHTKLEEKLRLIVEWQLINMGEVRVRKKSLFSTTITTMDSGKIQQWMLRPSVTVRWGTKYLPNLKLCPSLLFSLQRVKMSPSTAGSL